jgi:transcriptional regulator with XRE-family HTH domain
MASPEKLLQVLRAEMRAGGITYRLLAERVGMSESSVKRVFSQGDMSLSRLERFCKAAGVAMEDVLRQAADATPQVEMLTLAQERSLVEDTRLLLVAICCLVHWSAEKIVETYALTEPEVVRCLVQLDRLGLIELKPGNRFRMRVSGAFRWRADGPVQRYFREQVVDDYFSGRFEADGETLLCVQARLSPANAQEMVRRIQQLTGELSRLHQEDERLQPSGLDGYTLLLGFRSWELRAFSALRR